MLSMLQYETSFLREITIIVSLLLVARTQSSVIPLLTRDGPGDLQTDTHPFESTLYDVGGPTYKDVAQGTNGDCWLDAASAAVAYADQAHLMKIMVDTGDIQGQVNVTLYDGTPFNVKVVKPDLTDYKASESVATTDYVWPAVMERAFQAFATDHPDTQIAPTLNGGTIASSLQAMYGSGDSITYYTISETSDDDLWALWLKVGSKPTTSSTFGTDTASTTSSNPDMTDDGIPKGHAYTAIRCDQTKGIVTLRNPWGIVSQTKAGFSNNGGKGITGRGDGVFDISFADWKAEFVDIAAVS